MSMEEYENYGEYSEMECCHLEVTPETKHHLAQMISEYGGHMESDIAEINLHEERALHILDCLIQAELEIPEAPTVHALYLAEKLEELSKDIEAFLDHTGLHDQDPQTWGTATADVNRMIRLLKEVL